MQREAWKRRNPVDQYGVILESLEDEYDSYRHGLISEETLIKRVEEIMFEFKELRPFLETPRLWK